MSSSDTLKSLSQASGCLPAAAETSAAPAVSRACAGLRTLGQHWPEYLMEAAELGLFMISACTFTVLLEHPGSPAHGLLPDATLRRVLMGAAMGLTAILIIYSPWGKQSGAHMNPAVTLAFLRLRKVRPWDALFYVLAQFAGGIAGVMIAFHILGNAVAHPSVHYAVTSPVMGGVAIAFAAELAISFLQLTIVLNLSNHPKWSRYTGMAAGVMVAIYIAAEAPLSGMSMNPARTVGSAVGAGSFDGIWIYFIAPPLGMLLATEIYVRFRKYNTIFCAKFHHANRKRCIFRCGYGELVRMSDLVKYGTWDA